MSRYSPLFIDVSVDEATGLAFVDFDRPHEADELARISCLQTAIQRANGRLLSSGTAPTLMLVTAVLSAEISRDAHEIWPGQGAQRLFEVTPAFRNRLHELSHAAFGALMAHPQLRGSSHSWRIEAVLAGLGAQVATMSNAFATLRRNLVCHPLPHNFLLINPGGSTVATNGLHSPMLGSHRDIDITALSHALSGIPSLTRWQSFLQQHAPDAGSRKFGPVLQALLAKLSLDSLLLVYWLLCLAPTRLVRLACGPAPLQVTHGATSGDRTAAEHNGEVMERYAVVHGPPPQEWASCKHAQADSSVPSQCLCDGSGVRLWDEPAFAVHGALRASSGDSAPMLAYHGTQSENAHSIAHAGLRPLSNTRHEKSGSIYGEGVYLSGELAVSSGFSNAVGTAWDGMLPPSSQGTASRAGAAGACGDKGPSAPSQPLRDMALPSSPSAGGGSNHSSNATPVCLSAPCRFRPIFGCHVIASPEVSIVAGGKRIGSGSEVKVVPPGAYIVVPNALHVRVVELLLIRAPTNSQTAATGASAAAARPPGASASAKPKRGWCLSLLALFTVLALVLWGMSTMQPKPMRTPRRPLKS